MNLLTILADIGIIGGADGPTQILVTGGNPYLLIGAGLLLIAAIVGTVIIKKRSRCKNSDKK